MADPLSSPSAQVDGDTSSTTQPTDSTTTATHPIDITQPATTIHAHTIDDNQASTTDTTADPGWTPEEVIRQVEYYFSDENLVRDTHLLGKLQEAKYIKHGEGLVSWKQISSWGRMRQFGGPTSQVRDAIKGSKVLEVVNNKFIRRRIPFDMAKKTVDPAIREQELLYKKKKLVLVAYPHLTKGLLKKSGFEYYNEEPKLTPEELKIIEEDYSTDNTFYYRMELAIVRYRKKRTIHQETAKLFDYYQAYCGFAKNPAQFRGGLKPQDMEGLTKDEKETITMEHFALEEAKISLDEEDGEWVINFPGTLRGFFSTRYPHYFDVTHQAIVEASCNVLRNWFKWLLHHIVFAEYTDQLLQCLPILDAIEKELPLMAKASKCLPGAFNIAASIAMNGEAAASCVKQESYEDTDFKPDVPADAMVFTKQEARTIFLTGVVAYGTQAQIDSIEAHVDDLTKLRVIWEDNDVHLEVTKISFLSDADATTQELFHGLGHTIVPALGKMTCVRHEKPDFSDREPAPGHWDGHETFKFIVDEKAFKNCYVGLKFDAVVMELENGIAWIDHLHFCDGNFYKWCWNEVVDDAKKKAKKDPRGWGRWDNEGDKDGDGSADRAAADSDGDGDSDFEDH
ncbi:hypothetical protein B0A48_13888 [Cryoendolithus antarcticus]|uniref:HTH La-type RNA-binding domain-containing protein n=1 Tax=Cryoendolithus antarcticus TaxID=1507870 RepID=A0A1V8SLU6_9PEZI|nr:hypothetical protein B0A48_13888 [Cryoendolithus antarcticus]